MIIAVGAAKAMERSVVRMRIGECMVVDLFGSFKDS